MAIFVTNDPLANKGPQSKLLSREEALQFLAKWAIDNLGQILFFYRSGEKPDTIYTLVTGACPVCQSDLLEVNLCVEDQAPHAICRDGHAAYRALDGGFCEESAVRDDCWCHIWSGLGCCPKCQ